jgi:hypothetical protein
MLGWKFGWVLILYVLLMWMEVMVIFRFKLACEVIQLTGVQVWHQEGAGLVFIVH